MTNKQCSRRTQLLELTNNPLKTALYNHLAFGLFSVLPCRKETSSLWVMRWAVHADADMRPLWINTHAHKQSTQTQWWARVCSRMWDVWRTWAILELNEVTSVPSGWEKAPRCWSLQPPVVISVMMMPTASHAGTPTTPATHPNVPQLYHCSGPFHSPQAGLGIISLLRKKLCKSFHPPRCAQGPLTRVDILICCRQSLLAAPAITEQRAAWKKKKKKQIKPCWLAGGGQQWNSRKHGVELYR